MQNNFPTNFLFSLLSPVRFFRSRSTDQIDGVSIRALSENLIKLLEELDNKHSRTPRLGAGFRFEFFFLSYRL